MTTIRRPATAVRAVTVVGPQLPWTDVYATAAALLVTASGLLRATEGWHAA